MSEITASTFNDSREGTQGAPRSNVYPSSPTFREGLQHSLKDCQSRLSALGTDFEKVLSEAKELAETELDPQLKPGAPLHKDFSALLSICSNHAHRFFDHMGALDLASSLTHNAELLQNARSRLSLLQGSKKSLGGLLSDPSGRDLLEEMSRGFRDGTMQVVKMAAHGEGYAISRPFSDDFQTFIDDLNAPPTSSEQTDSSGRCQGPESSGVNSAADSSLGITGRTNTPENTQAYSRAIQNAVKSGFFYRKKDERTVGAAGTSTDRQAS